jgi:hypothetical protein
MAYRITGIRKPGGVSNTHEAISHYRWIEDGSTTSTITERMTVVGWVNTGHKFYVSDGKNTAWCGVRTSSRGTKFLQTYSDGKWNDNLLSLPQC